ECKAVYKGRQIETFDIDAVQEVSSMTNNDTVKEDDCPSRALPCQLPPKELILRSFALPCRIGSLNFYAIADLGTCVNIMPSSVFEYLKLTNLRKIDMLIGMANMIQQAPLGTVENDLVKIDKFVFPCDFVVIDMPGILGQMMVLGRPFLATIHAQIDVFNGEIHLELVRIGQEEEFFNDLELGDDLFSYESPACLRFEQNTRIYMNSNIETIDSPSNMLETSKGRANRLPDNERVASRWHVGKPVRVFYDYGSGKYCGIWPTCNPDLSFCSGYEAVYGKGEHGMLKQWVCFCDHEKCNVKGSCMEFADFLHVRYGNQKIDDTTRERIYYEWIAQNYEFDNDMTPSITTASHKYPDNIHYSTPPLLRNSLHNEWHTKNHTTYNIGSTSDLSIPITPRGRLAKKFANLYSRRFDEYRRVFNNEVEQLSNEYILRIEKKGYVLDDVWEMCEQNHRGTTYAWHGEGHEEEELWKSGIEKTEYEPPMVNVETFKVKRMIRDELGAGWSAQGPTFYSKRVEFKVISTHNHVVKMLPQVCLVILGEKRLLRMRLTGIHPIPPSFEV
ncbi:phospholipase-like protein, partial [Tanacetum coccineum]